MIYRGRLLAIPTKRARQCGLLADGNAALRSRLDLESLDLDLRRGTRATADCGAGDGANSIGDVRRRT
jgi:hypothetical protein